MNNRDRGRSFGTVAADYAAHRPDYPDAAVEHALCGRRGHVLDLGAGTGKLTASLVTRVRAVTAVDPDAAMLAQLRRRLPGVAAHEADAERIPLPDGSVDAVLCGQSLHWFATDTAMAEIARVLRSGGVLAALWNADDDGVEWVAAYRAAASAAAPSLPGVPSGRGRRDLPSHPAFDPARHHEFRHVRRLTVEGLIGSLGTHAWALVADPRDREAVYEQVRRCLADRSETASGTFDLPIVTTVLSAIRR